MKQLPPMIHSSWHQHLQPLFDDPKMSTLKNDLIPQAKFYPESKNIFRVFNMPLEEIKVVVLGQDPYPNGEAIGLAFAVNESVAMPKSLKIIHDEVKRNVGESNVEPFPVHKGFKTGPWKTLNHWFQQGVFLLNAALTVEAKSPASHMGYWAWFTREVIKVISKENPCIWVLWGGKAQAFEGYIHEPFKILKKEDVIEVNPNENIILKGYHPAAEAYDPTRKEKFSGCEHFSLCNQILKARGQQPINW